MDTEGFYDEENDGPFTLEVRGDSHEADIVSTTQDWVKSNAGILASASLALGMLLLGLVNLVGQSAPCGALAAACHQPPARIVTVQPGG